MSRVDLIATAAGIILFAYAAVAQLSRGFAVPGRWIRQLKDLPGRAMAARHVNVNNNLAEYHVPTRAHMLIESIDPADPILPFSQFRYRVPPGL
jgi:hypothetical protein